MDLLAAAERAASSGIALFTPVVVETGAYAQAGHGSAADWLGAGSGSSAAVAKSRLTAAERASGDRALTEALHDAELSAPQLKVLGETAVVVPGASETLLGLTEKGISHQELNDAATRLRAAALARHSEALRRARVQRARHLRWHQCPEGGIRGEFFCDEVAWAKVAPTLEAATKERWKAAGKRGGTALEAYRLDAFLDLLAGSGSAKGSAKGSRVETLVLVDAAALRRGSTQGDELCEIEGIGPVSVAAATELLSEGGFQYLVKEGFDIKTVTKSTRVIANCIDMALIVRDRVCARPGCGNSLGLERDHFQLDYGHDGPTELENLVRLCPECHKLKTDGGWRLEGRPGAWKWVAPAKPPSAQQMARARKVAVAKAKVFVKKDPSGPRRD